MDLTIRFVSPNLVPQTNFVEFLYSRIFHVFQDNWYPVTLKNEIFKKKLKAGK